MDTGRLAAQQHLDSLAEPRRFQMQHLHDVILEAIQDADVSMWDYSGRLIGYGSYDYSTSKGQTGRWFSVGLASRKSYISLYAMGTGDKGYLVETMHDRFPGTKAGRSCLNITRPELIDDDAVRELAQASWAQFRTHSDPDR